MRTDGHTTFESWMKGNMETSEIRDLASHGADAGWVGLTYYSDTCKLYDLYKDEIWKALSEDADEMGHKNPFEMISHFREANSVTCVESFENLMVWYMAERTAHRLSDQDE